MLRKVIVPITMLIILFALTRCGAAGGSTDPILVKKDAKGAVSFSKTILPILKDHCIRCHGEDRDGDLYILSYQGVMKGGKSGSFVIPGNPKRSRIVTSIEKTKVPYMPPRIFPELTDDRIQAIKQWITQGAEDN